MGAQEALPARSACATSEPLHDLRGIPRHRLMNECCDGGEMTSRYLTVNMLAVVALYKYSYVHTSNKYRMHGNTSEQKYSKLQEIWFTLKYLYLDVLLLHFEGLRSLRVPCCDESRLLTPVCAADDHGAGHRGHAPGCTHRGPQPRYAQT